MKAGFTAVALMLMMASFEQIALAAAAASPEQRVTAFIADYFHAHSRSGGLTADSDADFKRWAVAVDKLDAAHFADRGGQALATMMSSAPSHHPELEKIIRNTIDGDRVFIETTAPEGALGKFHEYELRKVGNDWRIVRIRDHQNSADALFMTDKERPRFENPKTLPLKSLSAEESNFDGSSLFAAGKTEIRRVGQLNVTTGVLVVGDLAYDPWPLSPVGQRVAPGRYPVEISIALQRIAALRVVFSSAPVAKWHPADMGDGGHGTGVDAGDISISDVSALLTVNSRFKDRLVEKYADLPGHTNALMLTLVNPDDAVIANSGYGDGRYPVYWGVDADGKLAVLLIDLYVLPENVSLPADQDR